MSFFEPVLDRIKNKFPDVDAERIERAYEYARDAHEGQRRFSGEPYVTHPVAVVNILLDYGPDEDMMVAALLHDVSEDTERTLDDIELAFGMGVRRLVSGLEKLAKVRSRVNEPAVENLRKMFMSMSSDLRIIVIKLCDRLHNMSTLSYVKPHKQERIAKETLNIYVPIAARLGIYRLKGALEDYCFEFLNDEDFKHINEQMQRYTKRSKPIIEEMRRALQKRLAMQGFEHVLVEARLKSNFSIFNKLNRKGKSMVDELYDVFALRVIMPDQVRDGEHYTGHLYSVIGAIHSQWTPLPNRFKDYVAVPKPNGYRSLHTTVIGLGPRSHSLPTEIQIRTQTMHDEAERGIASHWLYDETGGRSATMKDVVLRGRAGYDWVSALTNYQEEVDNNQEFVQALENDFFNKRIFVFTPAGDVKDLPKGATPVDFAYTVHSDVGNKCVMAKMNGLITPLDSELRNGTVVEIITRDNAEPSQYWLSFVKTSSARSKIKSWFKSNADPQKMLREGKEILNKHLERLSKPILDADLLLLKNYGGERLTTTEREELLRDVGRGVLLPNQVIKTLFPASELLRSRTRIAKLQEKKNKRIASKKVVDLSREVILDGHEDLPLKMANCCKPVLLEPIRGFVTRGQGITIHKQNCKVLLNANYQRTIDASWKSDKREGSYRVSLEIVMESRVGMLLDISNALTHLKINITQIEFVNQPKETDLVFREFEIEVRDYDQLAVAIEHLQRIPDIKIVRKVA